MEITLNLPEDYVEEMDSLIGDEYENRNEMIKELVAKKLEDYDVHACIACGRLNHVFGGKQYDDGFVCFNCQEED